MNLSHKEIVTLLANQLPTLNLVYLFGSRATNQYRVDSDWDIAIACATKLDNVERWNIAQDLAIALNADVDLVDLLDASTVLQMQVVEHGQRLFEKDDLGASFEMQVFSMYGRLQESRNDIVNNFIDDIKNAWCFIK